MNARSVGTALMTCGLVALGASSPTGALATEPATVGVGATLEEDGDALVLVLSTGQRATVCPGDSMRFDGWDAYSSTVEPGVHWAKVQCATMMGSFERVAFVDATGKVADLSPLATVRGDFPHPQCIWGAAMGATIVLWDLEYDKEPKECDDAAQSGAGFTIPRHYELDPATGAIEMKRNVPACISLDLSSGEYVRCVQPKKD